MCLETVNDLKDSSVWSRGRKKTGEEELRRKVSGRQNRVVL